MSGLKAIFWDFGGVITTSPFEAFNLYEAERGIPLDFIRETNAVNADDNAWAKLERNDIGVEEFSDLFEAETRARGYPIPGRDVVARIYGAVRPEMVAALEVCRARVTCGCLTNNFLAPEQRPIKSPEVQAAMGLFSFVLESSVAGVRKPDPRFYQIALEKAGVDPADVLMLDDLGVNLKPARAMGMRTIKVTSPAQALADLARETGFPIEVPAAAADA